jgi:hypothetical protein
MPLFCAQIRSVWSYVSYSSLYKNGKRERGVCLLQERFQVFALSELRTRSEINVFRLRLNASYMEADRILTGNALQASGFRKLKRTFIVHRFKFAGVKAGSCCSLPVGILQ